MSEPTPFFTAAVAEAWREKGVEKGKPKVTLPVQNRATPKCEKSLF